MNRSMTILPAAAAVITASLSAAEHVATDVSIHMSIPYRPYLAPIDAAAAPPVTLIAAHALRIIQQVSIVQGTRVDNAGFDASNLTKQSLAKLTDELHACPFTALIKDFKMQSPNAAVDEELAEIITLMWEIPSFAPKLRYEHTEANRTCLSKLCRLFKLSVKKL